MIWLIAQRDLLAVFRDGSAWFLLAVAQVPLAWIFLGTLDPFLEPTTSAAGLDLALTRQVFGAATVLLLVVTPLLAGRALGSELQAGLEALHGTAPLRLSEWLLGKFLATAILNLPFCLLPLALCLSLYGTAPLDVGVLLAATLGLWLASLAFAAVGLFAASLSARPATAAPLAYALLLLLSVLARGEELAAAAVGWLSWLSWQQHLFWPFVGVVRSSDVLYFVLLSALFLALAHRQLDNRRYR